jgi:hypothetical protein
MMRGGYAGRLKECSAFEDGMNRSSSGLRPTVESGDMLRQ